MEKEVGRITKNSFTEIVLKLDAFGGKPGLTIREFSSGDRYTGFTKSGTKIPAERFEEFKHLINGITSDELKLLVAEAGESAAKPTASPKKAQKKLESKSESLEIAELDEDSEDDSSEDY